MRILHELSHAAWHFHCFSANGTDWCVLMSVTSWQLSAIQDLGIRSAAGGFQYDVFFYNSTMSQMPK